MIVIEYNNIIPGKLNKFKVNKQIFFFGWIDLIYQIVKIIIHNLKL